MSQKPGKATEEDKKKRKRKKKTKQALTHAVTHIRLIEANSGKLDALDQLVVVFAALCQQYVTLFCTTETSPDKYADPVFESELSERWQRVCIQQAAGIAKSWRTNRQAAYDAYLEDLANYATAKVKAETSGVPLDPKCKEPLFGTGFCNYTTEGVFNEGGKQSSWAHPTYGVDLQKDANSWQEKQSYTMNSSFVL